MKNDLNTHRNVNIAVKITHIQHSLSLSLLEDLRFLVVCFEEAVIAVTE